MTTKACDIVEGGYFRKITGTYAYLRISKASVKHHGLGQDFVYGVCFNGNITCLKADREVVEISIEEFLENVEQDRDWHRTVGASHKC